MTLGYRRVAVNRTEAMGGLGMVLWGDPGRRWQTIRGGEKGMRVATPQMPAGQDIVEKKIWVRPNPTTVLRRRANVGTES